MKNMLIYFFAICLLGCTDEYEELEDSNKESMLKIIEENTVWPYEIKGNIEFIDCGFNGNDNEIPSWCVGMIDTEIIEDFDDDVSIQTCGHEVFKKHNIDVDNTQKIAVLIEKTNNSQGESDCSLGEFSKVEIGTRVYRIINMKYYQ